VISTTRAAGVFFQPFEQLGAKWHKVARKAGKLHNYWQLSNASIATATSIVSIAKLLVLLLVLSNSA